MANIATPQRVQTPESDSPELDARVAQQVADILEADLTPLKEAAPARRGFRESRPARWGYTVPFAGVRYYSF